jgi:hypothetical protein
MHTELLKKIDESTKILETKIQKIIDDFELKTNTKIILDVKNDKVEIGLAIDVDKSTL